MNTNMKLPMVSIWCFVYNQESYIRQCLEGVILQKTNFKIEVIIHDDASSDHTPDIIREYAKKYPDIIKPIYETENQYSKHDGSLRSIMNNACKGKYIAFCEGDDYWIDPLKLQKQIDFLEKNPEYGMCCGNASIYKENIGKICGTANKEVPYFSDNENKEEVFNSIVFGRGGGIVTATVVYRSDVRSRIIGNDKFFLMEDTPLWLDISQLSKIKYFDEIFSVYRVHEGSASRPKSTLEDWRFTLSVLEMRIYYYRKYGYHIPKQSIKKYRNALCATMTLDPHTSILFEDLLSKLNRFYIFLIRKDIINIIIKPIVILKLRLKRFRKHILAPVKQMLHSLKLFLKRLLKK